MDLRIVKTKKAIRRAFFELIQTKDVQEITIKEISDLAEIDRKTFYSHYSAIYELVDELEDEAIKKVADLVYDIDGYNLLTDPKVMSEVLQTITEDEAFSYLRYLCVKSSDDLLGKFKDTVKSRMASEFRPRFNLEDSNLSIVVDYTIAGITTCYQNWLRQGKKVSINKLSEEISKIAVFGLSGLVN